MNPSIQFTNTHNTTRWWPGQNSSYIVRLRVHWPGMIQIRINDPRSLGSSQRYQWIHTDREFIGFFDAPWSKWSCDYFFFYLHSLGMIQIRISDPRSLESNQRNQWIHSGPFGFFDASRWFKVPLWSKKSLPFFLEILKVCLLNTWLAKFWPLIFIQELFTLRVNFGFHDPPLLTFKPDRLDLRGLDPGKVTSKAHQLKISACERSLLYM